MTGKGHAAERELSDELEDTYNFAAMPAGGSGSGTDRARPDVFACRRHPTRNGRRPGTALCVEVKAWSDGTGHLDGDEVDALEWFTARAGGTAWVAVRPDRRRFDGWHLHRADGLHETGGGNYSVRVSDRPGVGLEQAIRESGVSDE